MEVITFYHQKYVFRKKAKYMTVKVFNMIKSKNETKTMEKHISCDFRLKFNNTTCNSNQKWNMKTWQFECKNYRTCKKIILGILAYIVVDDKYLKSIADPSVVTCDEIISVMDIVSTKMTNNITTNAFFFLSGFSFTNICDSQDSRGEGRLSL